MGVSENSGTPKSSTLIGFSIINHPFWGTPIFGNTHNIRTSLGGDVGGKKHEICSGSEMTRLFIPERKFQTLPKRDLAAEVVYSLKRGNETSAAIMSSCSLRLFNHLK